VFDDFRLGTAKCRVAENIFEQGERVCHEGAWGGTKRWATRASAVKLEA
jgi:hypothetical protein